jgi:type VI secretion system protein ImpI
VAIVFVLRAFQLNDSLVVEKRLSSLPIRIGRNALADFQVNHRYVSDFHALIEDVDARLYVRDLKSKNGVHVHIAGQPLPINVSSQAAVDLATCGFQFFLGVHVRVSIEFEHANAPMSVRASTVMGSVLGNQAILVESAAPPPPIALPAQPAFNPPRATPPPNFGPSAPPAPAWDPSPRAPTPLPQGFAENRMPGALPPLAAGVMASPAPNALPALGSPGFEPVRAPMGWSPEAAPQGLASTGLLHLTLEAMALQGLRELAGSLVPGKDLTTTGDVARFITKLHDTIEVFSRCFIPLREGYAQFVSSLDLQKASMQRSMMRSSSYMAVESAREPAAVAAALLDWRDRSMDAPKAIEGIFADLMIHQVALLDGVMQGVRALLEQLSPENIEQQTGPQGLFAFDRSRAKALWDTYRARFEELAEEKQAFAHIFGPQFTEAYREYRKQRQE